MEPYSRVIEILEASVSGQQISAHGNFWRGKTRDEFVALKVFGKQLLVLGDGENSTLIKALRAIKPFGNDVDPPTAGALYPRMPARRDPVDEDSIAFISAWITAGCPEVDQIEAFADQPIAEAALVQFFREFDDFFMYSSTQETDAQVGAILGDDGLGLWPGYGVGTRAQWDTVLAQPSWQAAVTYLSKTQLDIFRRHFGEPLRLSEVSRALFAFGRDSLPDDTLRPVDPNHRMNGATMWLVWLAFADAAGSLGVESATWEALSRSVVLGMVADALFRLDRPPAQRLRITRYQAADPDLMARILADFQNLEGVVLRDAVAGIAREAIGA